MHIRHFNVASIALVVGLAFAALPMDADAQSRTRLVMPDASNSPDNRARADLPQQVVTFNLRPVSNDSARAGLPQSDRVPAVGNTIAFISQKVRVHDLFDVTLTRSPLEPIDGRPTADYYQYCLWVEYDASIIPPREQHFIIDVFWSWGDLFPYAETDEVAMLQLYLKGSSAGQFLQPICQGGGDPGNQAPQSVPYYFSRPFALFPFRTF